MIPQQPICQAARSALWWDLLRNLADPFFVLFFVGTWPQGISVCAFGEAAVGTASFGALSKWLEAPLPSPRAPVVHPQPSDLPQKGHGQSRTHLVGLKTSCELSG